MDYALFGGRFRLLEAGLGLGVVGGHTDYASRLVDPNQYVEACAELASAYMWQQMGFEVEREPLNRDAPRRAPKKGPDFRVTKGELCLGVEVKCPKLSEDQQVRLRFGTDALFATMALAGEPLALDLRGVERATLRIPGEGREHALRVLIERDFRGAHPAISPSPHFTIPSGLDPDPEHEQKRLLETAQDAAAQLRQLRVPGVVVIDTTQDIGLMDEGLTLANSLWEPWARELAAVALVQRTLPGFLVTWLVGPRFELLLGEFGASRICARGHFHVASVGARPDCRGERRLSIAVGAGWAS
jgi:hypothetical protein